MVADFVDIKPGMVLAALAQCRETTVPDDSEQPRLAVIAAQAVDVAKGPQRGGLYRIARVAFLTHNPARQIVGSIQMAEHRRFESSSPRICCFS